MKEVSIKTKIKKEENLALKNLEYFLEQKILEILRDTDYSMELREDFKEKLKNGQKKSGRVSHKEVLNKLGKYCID